MKGIKAKYNVDKLTVCYTTNNDVIEDLMDTNFIDYDTFQLVRYNDKDKLFADCFLIRTKDIDESGGLKWIEFAKLKFNMRISNNDEAKNYVWIYFNNPTLYTLMYPEQTIITEMEYIADTLKLKINNVTSLDIAYDSNRNIAKRVRKAIFNDKMRVTLNGTTIYDLDEVLDEVKYLQKGNQRKITDLSVYVSQKRKDGFELCIYDKTKEAKYRSKDYIIKLMSTKQNIFRAEVRLKSQHLKEYFEKKPDFILDMIYTYLNEKSFREEVFMEFANRLLRFRNEKDDLLSILDV